MSLRALALRPVLARPVRLAVTVAGVALGVASVVSTVLASRAAVDFLGRDVEALAGRAALEVTAPGGVALETLGALRPLCGEVLVAPVIEGSALAPGIGDLVRVLGLDLLVDRELRAFELEGGGGEGEGEDDGEGGDAAGEAFDALLRGRGVALSASLAEALGVAPGGRVELVARSRPVELELAARFVPARVSSAWERVVLCDLGLAAEVLGRTRLDRVELLPRAGALDGPALDALAARVAAALPPGHRVAPAAARRADGQRMVRALEFNLTALSGVSLLVAVVLVATTLATSVVQRRAAIAILRSLGASRAQLAATVLFEAALIGALGGLLGLAFGWLGARVALPQVRTTVATVAAGALPGEVRVTPGFAALALALGLCTAVAAALLPLREALRTPPAQGLRSEHPESVAMRPWRVRAVLIAGLLLGAWGFASLPPIGDRPLWALLSALLLLGSLLALSAPLVDLCAALRPFGRRGRLAVALRVAQAALEAGRRRAAWAAGAVGVAVGLAVSMSTMVGSFRQTVVDWTGQTMRSDLFVRPLAGASGVATGGVDPEVVAVAQELFGPEAVDPFHTALAWVGDDPVSLAGAAFAVVAREGGVPFLDGRPSGEVFAEALARGAAVVNEPFARRFGVAPGDRITLQSGGGPLALEVAGVYRDYSGHTGRVVIDRAPFLARHPDEPPQNMAIFLPEGVAPDAARRRLATALGARFEVELLLNAEIRREVLAVFDRTFAVTVALQGVASVVAAIAVVTVLGALVHERRRELAVLRVLGGSRLQVAGVVLGEALLLGLAGALGGLVVGLVVGWVLVAVVNVQSFGWTLRYLPPWRDLAWTLGSVVPACLVAGIVPALLALRATPREVLRELA